MFRGSEHDVAHVGHVTYVDKRLPRCLTIVKEIVNIVVVQGQQICISMLYGRSVGTSCSSVQVRLW